MDNSKYVFEMKENVPVRTGDATPPVKGNYFMRGDKITYEGKKGVVKNAYGDVVVVQLEGDPKGDYRHLSYYTVKHARDARTSDAKPLHEMNANELRDLAVSLGADKNKLYGTSKQALIVIIDKLKREKSNDMRTVDEVVTVNESDFVSSHVKNPKGYGHWIFGIGSKNMSDWFETTGTYAESKKRAIEEAKKKGKTTVYTMG